MIYPIAILENKLVEISNAVARIDHVVFESGQKEDKESILAKKKLFKRAKDLRDAISVLNEYSTVGEVPVWNADAKSKD